MILYHFLHVLTGSQININSTSTIADAQHQLLYHILVASPFYQEFYIKFLVLPWFYRRYLDFPIELLTVWFYKTDADRRLLSGDVGPTNPSPILLIPLMPESMRFRVPISRTKLYWYLPCFRLERTRAACSRQTPCLSARRDQAVPSRGPDPRTAAS